MGALGLIGKDSKKFCDLLTMTLKSEKDQTNYLIKKIRHAALKQHTIFSAKRTNHGINPIFLVGNEGFHFCFLLNFFLIFNCILYHNVPSMPIL